MKISHVIRGQEFLASVPTHSNLYEALGFDKPVFATMPHILNPSGGKKNCQNVMSQKTFLIIKMKAFYLTL
jgi:glutamyl/glutaminyl-tRNA synthetase